MSDTANQAGFSALGLSPQILSILDQLGFTTPTPIQHRSIPPCVEGKDVIGIAQTGTGKTLAYGLPMIQRLQAMKGQGLILLPTRELALQVEETLRKTGKSLGITSTVLIGSESMNRQISELRRKPRIIVATPGRLMDHLQQRTASLADVKILVFDEADRMLDMGFAPQINQILKSVPKERQTLLYSATMPDAIVTIATSQMKMPVRVEVAPAGTAAEKVEQEIVIVPRDGKYPLLENLLREHAGTVLVFCRTKRGAEKLCRSLNKQQFGAAELHSNCSQSQRKRALDGFRKGDYRVLVATDIAARGIDVTHIELVVNYDLPDNIEDYVHRIGRTGRAGKEGKAISFAHPDQGGEIRAIERLIRRKLKVTSKGALITFPEGDAGNSRAPGHRPQGQRPRPQGGDRRPQPRGRFNDRRGPDQRPAFGNDAGSAGGEGQPFQRAGQRTERPGQRPQRPGGQRPPRSGSDRPQSRPQSKGTFFGRGNADSFQGKRLRSF